METECGVDLEPKTPPHLTEDCKRMTNARTLQAFIIYVSLLLDNVLLTVIVPILPDYLAQLQQAANAPAAGLFSIPQSVAYKSFDLHYVPTILGKHPLAGSSLINFTASSPFQAATTTTTLNGSVNDADDLTPTSLSGENGSIGILLATKALVQLVVTPFVGSLTLRLGYRIPIVFGTFCLLVASLVFASGSSYMSLLLARSMQGVASACIGVCGMSLVAQLYPEDARRSRVMGVILGSVALGVLVGYPFGGILYDFVGKSAPFYILAVGILCNLVLQLCTMDLHDMRSEVVRTSENSTPCVLLTDATIVKIITAIWISTSAMAILEPCLPIWLMENLHPHKWQIGTVFIPDSIGYFVGTNFFGTLAYRMGQINISVCSLLIVGLSCFVIPTTASVLGLLIPHFTLGLGIGVLDAALVPMLATLVDARYSDDESASTDSMSNYGAVYAIQQMSVSLAYSLAPMLGGQVAQHLGFRSLMFAVGTMNVIYAMLLLVDMMRSASWMSRSTQRQHPDATLYLTENAAQPSDYKRFYNTIDIP